LGGVGKGKTNMCKQIFLRHQSSGKKFQKLYVITCDKRSKEWLDCEPTFLTEDMVDIDMFDPKKKTMVIIDDWEMERCSTYDRQRLSTLFRFISSHRNCSVILSYQSFYDCLNIARKCANCFMIYEPTSRKETTLIENSTGLDKGTLRLLFDTKCDDDYDHVFIDRTIGSPYKLRKNIYKKLKMPSLRAIEKHIQSQLESESDESDSDSDSE
jgi:hypothetical protein